MGRPSKLTDAQKADIQKRLASGETQRAIAKEFGVSNGTVAALFVGRSTTIKTLANTIATVESQVELLSISEQVIVRSMADQIKAMQIDYTRGASTGLQTAAKLHEIAKRKVEKLDPSMVETEDLRVVAALTDTANKAAAMGTNLLNANKDKGKDASTLEDLVTGAAS